MSNLGQELERVCSRSINFIKLGKTQIRVDPYSFLFIAATVLFGILCDILNIRNGYYLTSYIIVVIILVYMSVILHEFGHWLSNLYYNCKSDYILLSYRVCCVSSNEADELSEKQKAVCAFAGPCTNLILCAVIGCIMHMYGDSLSNMYILEILNISFITNGLMFLGNMFHDDPMADGKKVFSYLKSVV